MLTDQLKIINRKYKIIQKIGEGAFGSIYKGENIRTKENVAIKVEPISCDLKLLKNESKVYQFLINTDGFPTVKWFGKDNENYYMVIDLLGQSLQSLLHSKQHFSLPLILQIGIQIIQLLKVLHDNGLVHRDIKPDNFLLGLNDKSRIIHIIDFGFCKSYLQNDTHIEIKNTKNLIGTPMFASVNAHKHLELSRRDDLESLGYMLLYFYHGGALSWEKETCNDTIICMKENAVYHENNKLHILSQFIKQVRQLQFKETPPYSSFINAFQEGLLKA